EQRRRAPGPRPRRADVPPGPPEVPRQAANADPAERQRVEVEERRPQQAEEAEREQPQGEDQHADRQVEQQPLPKRKAERRQQPEGGVPHARAAEHPEDRRGPEGGVGPEQPGRDRDARVLEPGQAERRRAGDDRHQRRSRAVEELSQRAATLTWSALPFMRVRRRARRARGPGTKARPSVL